MEVNPEKQNIDALFSRQNYYIDFYQREYKWGKGTVVTCHCDSGMLCHSISW